MVINHFQLKMQGFYILPVQIFIKISISVIFLGIYVLLAIIRQKQFDTEMRLKNLESGSTVMNANGGSHLDEFDKPLKMSTAMFQDMIIKLQDGAFKRKVVSYLLNTYSATL